TMPAGSPNTSLVTLGLSSFAPLSCKITALTLLINFPNISRAKGQLIKASAERLSTLAFEHWVQVLLSYFTTTFST
ncbi:MAG: hypothetical protein NXI26_19730, partial [bacterium]|nr:hypothetical protein [bacterium]